MISVKSDWELFTKVERGCVGFISNFNTHEFPRLMTIHRLTTQHVKKLQKKLIEREIHFVQRNNVLALEKY